MLAGLHPEPVVPTGLSDVGLEQLGYDAYDYVPGKADWLAYGLPYNGTAQLIGDPVTPDVATCGSHERLGEVRARLEQSHYSLVAVLNAEGVVLGQLGRHALDVDDDTAVAYLMAEGPATVRPSEEAARLAERMRRPDVDGVLVTRSDGTLTGLLKHRAAQAAATEAQ